MSDFEIVVRRYVALGSGISTESVIPGNSAGALPESLFATVLPYSDSPTGMPDIYITENSEIIDHGIVALFSVQWYRMGARDCAIKFRSWMYSEEAGRASYEMGITPQVPAGLVQIDAIISSEYEERMQMNLSVGWNNRLTFGASDFESPIGVGIQYDDRQLREVTLNE